MCLHALLAVYWPLSLIATIRITGEDRTNEPLMMLLMLA